MKNLNEFTKSQKLFMKNLNEDLHKNYENDSYKNNYMFESSLSRVWKHSQNGYIMMSAFRGTDSKVNMENHKKLKAELKKLQLGFFEIDGVYKYTNGTTEAELSVFIPIRSDKYSVESFKSVGLKLRKKFNQESILYSDGKSATLIYANKEDKIGTKVGPDKIGDAYSVLRNGSHKGRSFIIEGFRVPSNHISAYGLQEEGVMWY